jgi:hypothetical protein
MTDDELKEIEKRMEGRPDPPPTRLGRIIATIEEDNQRLLTEVYRLKNQIELMNKIHYANLNAEWPKE